MKKILLLFVTLLLTGCYDHIELNDLSIISAIGIDYDTDHFILTMEVLTDNDTTKDISASGNTISKALENASVIINKTPYYYHLKAIIISEEIANNHLSEITDYFLRNPKIIHSFYLVMCKDISSKDFLAIKEKNKIIVGNEIVSKMENNEFEYGISYTNYFEDVLERLINDKKDPIMTTLVVDDDNIKIYGISLFKKDILVTTLDSESSSYLNILLSSHANLSLENEDLIINIYDNKTTISFDKKIIIKVNSEAEIVANKNNNKLKKDESYVLFNQKFSKLLNDKLTSLLERLNELDVDPLCLKWKYYQKYQKDMPSDLKIELYTNVLVNKKGLIFEADYD